MGSRLKHLYTEHEPTGPRLGVSCEDCMTLETHDSHETIDPECPLCEKEMTASAALAGRGGPAYSRAELEEARQVRHDPNGIFEVLDE